MRQFFLGVALLTLSNVAAFAQELPAPLAQQKANGAQVFYLGRYEGLDGWALIRSGQPEFYYAPPGGKALVMGLLFDDKGNMMTNSQLANLAPEKQDGIVNMLGAQALEQAQKQGVIPSENEANDTPAAAATAPLATPSATDRPQGQSAQIAAAPATQIQQTPAPKVVQQQNSGPGALLFEETRVAASTLLGQPGVPAFYAFIDPNCPHCQRFLREADPYVKAGKIAIHIIPVAFDEKSKQQAAMILGAGDGAQRMLNYSNGDTLSLPAQPGLNDEAVLKNVAILTHWNIVATPIILYRAGGGTDGEIKIVRGRPRDIAAAVADLTGKK